MYLSLIVATFGMFSVPQLSHDSVTRLVQHYFKENPPEVYLGDAPSETPLNDRLVASGLFSSYDWERSCGGDLTGVHLTPYGREVAQRGWSVKQDGESIMISLGSFSLVTESLTYSKESGLPGSIHFMYWFKANANVPYLLSLAPATAWGSVGMDDGGGVTLDKANRLIAGTLPIRWDDGWVIQGPYKPPPPIC